MKRLICALLVVAVSWAVTTIPASAAPKPVKYKNCSALNKVYPSGVAQSQAATLVAVADGSVRPAVNSRVYNLNKKQDRDRDLVACETPAPAAVASGITYKPTGIAVFDALNRAESERGEITQAQSNALTRMGKVVASTSINTKVKDCPFWPYEVYRTGYLDSSLTSPVLAAIGLTDADADWAKAKMSTAVTNYCLEVGAMATPF
jgi:hypothetical protein